MALTIALACGGTGGHVFPALAAGEHLRSVHGFDLVVLGRGGFLEQTLAERAGVPFASIPASPLHRSGIWRNLSLPITMVRSVAAARKVLRRTGARAVLATGGYVSLPTGIAARTLGLPVVVHESNAHPGVANRLLARLARKLLVGSPAGALAFAPAVAEVVGNPVRTRDARTREELRAARGIGGNERYLVVIGGSQGGRGLNAILAAEIRSFVASGWKVLWQTGPAGLEAAKVAAEGIEGVRVEAFVHDVFGELGAADLALTRAGASTLAELALFALPSVLVPFPYATGNHQESNAREMAVAGAAELLVERDWRDGAALAALERLFARRQDASRAMASFSRPDAAREVARVVASTLEARP
ncbi:MAG: UDP-N-acetylglucosamine--N-acetylmuramyl-(pentapeptide) pyrophosphoryl-undecaprenol N-acetylglucosamine transferase [Fibrobacteria bacterium]|nr:UDP-N-acetylglucosamine--N-acetylmuramyl-(pentapeptide) pyrophosphoryl-undecaprenol N-acetylglucosamine transferase [Fibrobacteria bacterium]